MNAISNITRAIVQPIGSPVGVRAGDRGFISAGISNPYGTAYQFPIPGAVIDIDFVAQRYYWNGAERTFNDLTTKVLGTSTFGPNGLTPSGTFDITLALAGTGFALPGTVAFAYTVPASVPGAAETVFQLDDGSGNNRIFGYWNINQRILTQITTGGVSQGSLQSAVISTAIRTGTAERIETNNHSLSTNGAPAVTPDTSVALPVVTTLRVGENAASGSPALNPIGRITYFASAKSNTELAQISAAMLFLPWRPTDLGADLIEWWDPADLVNGAQAASTTWTGKKLGIVLTAEAGGGGTKSATSLGGQAGITFAAVNDASWLASSIAGLPVGTTPSQHYAMVIATPTATITAIATTAGSLGQRRMIKAANEALTITDNTINCTGAAGDLTGLPQVVVGEWGASAMKGWYHGNASVGNPTAAALDSGTAVRFRIGGAGSATSTNEWDGIQGRHYITTVLSDANRQKMEGYLAHFYAAQATLPASHPYKTLPPTV